MLLTLSCSHCAILKRRWSLAGAMECASEGSGSSAGLVVFERRQLYKWMEESGFRIFADRIKFVKSKLAERYNVEYEFASFAEQLKLRWDRSRSVKNRFEKRNGDWLKGTVKLGYIRAERSHHQRDCAPEATKKPKPIISAKEELVPEDAIFDYDLESVCVEAEEECEEILVEAGDTREPEPFVEFECDAPSMTSSKPIDSGVFLPGQMIFACNLCDYTCLQGLDLMRHKKIHLGENVFTCEQCPYLCRLEYELEVHKVAQHFMPKLYHCCKCNYFSRNRKNMAVHQEIHLSLRQYHCDTCNHHSQELALGVSELSNPARAEPFLCDKCGFCCMREDTLQRHQSSHSGEALLHSDIGDYNCQQDPDLKKHQKTHMSEMLLSCDRCKYRCHDEFDFKRHLMSHAKEKCSTRCMVYACNLCDFRCQFRDSLKLHIMTHVSEEASFSGEDSASSLDLE